MKIDIGLMGEELRSVPTRTAQLADLGADGVFCAEGPNDIFVALVLAASAGRTVDLSTNAAIALPRNPIHLAHAAWDLQVLSEGRFRLGLASQIRTHIERRFGETWSQPVDRMKETVQALKAIFATWQDGVPLDFEGEYRRHTLMAPMFNPGPIPFGPPPILLGAVGPRMTAMAAEVADGIMVLPFHTDRSLHEHTVAPVERGLAEYGRSRSEFELICGVIVGVGSTGPEHAEALAGVRALLGFYGSTPAYRPVLDIEGWGDLQPTLRQLTRDGQWGTMGDLIEDDMVEALSVTGSPNECAKAIKDRLGAIADRVALFFPYRPSDDTLGQLLDALKEPLSA